MSSLEENGRENRKSVQSCCSDFLTKIRNKNEKSSLRRYRKRRVIEGHEMVNSRRRIFSQGSSMERTKVDSNHMRLRQKNCPSLDFGRRVKVWLGFAGGRCACAGTVAVDIMVGRKEQRITQLFGITFHPSHA